MELILCNEQNGNERAQYGKRMLSELSKKLTSGIIMTKPQDILRDPYVFEFLGIREESIRNSGYPRQTSSVIIKRILKMHKKGLKHYD